MKFFILFVSLLVIGCGKENSTATGSAVGSDSKSGTVYLQLPATLPKDSPRFKRFLPRVRHLEFRVKQKGLPDKVSYHTPQTWEAMSFFVPNSNASDSIEIIVNIWDYRKGGSPRPTPVLTGSKGVKFAELSGHIQIKLSLEISVAELD